MNPTQPYFLLTKNNSLQTIDDLISPYVYATKDKEEILGIKQQLELGYLKHTPIHFHFDHIETPCDEEIISFDKFLLDNYAFSFLAEGFDHRQKELGGQILYNQKFPKRLSNEELLIIQDRMDKYHFKLKEQEPNNKAIIILNPLPLDNPLRDGEIFKLQEFFNSKNEAKDYIDKIIEGQFDLNGTSMTVGDIRESELTDKTRELLNSQCDIQYKSRLEDNGMKFFSSNKLGDIVNGIKILLGLFESVGKKPYDIVLLK